MKTKRPTVPNRQKARTLCMACHQPGVDYRYRLAEICAACVREWHIGQTELVSIPAHLEIQQVVVLS